MAILFVVFTGIALVISNEVIFSYLQESSMVSPLLQIIALFFLILLVGILLIQLWRLFSAFRRNEPAIKYKIRLVAFFTIIVFLSTLPMVLLTANILRRAFDVWFVQDTNDSLKYGLENTVKYFTFRSENLSNFSSGEAGQNLVRNMVKNPDSGWKRIQSLNSGIDSVQVYDSQGRELALVGDISCSLPYDRAVALAGLSVRNTTILGKPTLVSSQYLVSEGSPTLLVICCSNLPPHFDANAELLSRTEKRLSQYRDFGLSFPLYIFAAYVLFLVPLIILAILTGLYVAELLVGPLVRMDEAVQRVSSGDFRTRLVARRGDGMAPFITSFNRMVEELDGSRQVIQQAERIQTWQDIAQRLAHEIKNPLTPIKLSAERILKKHQAGSADLGRIIEESVGIIVSEVEGLSLMLTEFRDFARLPSPVPQPVQLSELIWSVWTLYADSRNVNFEFNIQPGNYVDVDRGQIQQVFKNLFQNALDAMPSNSAHLIVSDSVLERGGQSFVRILIKDNGSGMSPQVLTQIFDPYFTSKKGGTGLGLAICEKIILDHGGRIWAESQVGVGSSFYIDLRRSSHAEAKNGV